MIWENNLETIIPETRLSTCLQSSFMFGMDAKEGNERESGGNLDIPAYGGACYFASLGGPGHRTALRQYMTGPWGTALPLRLSYQLELDHAQYPLQCHSVSGNNSTGLSG